jgi:hypothetical protein
MNVLQNRNVRAWLILAGICLVQVACVWRLHPTNYFGLSGDDSIYFTSARALAEGKGYVLPSLPGSPPATKYPILYPWLLSWVWRWNPSFPANLSVAAALNMTFGVLYVVMTFLFLRGLKRLSDTAILFVTGFCALHPIVLLYSANLLADIPFAAATLAAIVLATIAIEKDSGAMSAAYCGIVVGAGVLLRVLGAPVAAGIYLAIALRAGWRKSTVFAAAVAPFFLGLYWRLISSSSRKPPFAFGDSPCSRSLQNTWLFFTDYLAFYRADSISSHLFWKYVATNIKFVVYQLGAYFIDLQHLRPTPLVIILLVLVCAAAIRGLLRQIQMEGWHPVHFALALYLLPVLIWDYPSPERFLIPFLPLIVAGVWLECSKMAREAYVSLHKHATVKEWSAAGVCVLVTAAVTLVVGVSWWRGIGAVVDVSNIRGTVLVEKREAYEWLRDNSSPEEKIIAYEQASAYLYSGLQGLPTTVLSQAGKDRPDILKTDLSCLLSTAEPIGARYWVAADDDFKLEWEGATVQEKSIQARLEASVLPVFRSHSGHVRIYSMPLGTP